MTDHYAEAAKAFASRATGQLILTLPHRSALLIWGSPIRNMNPSFRLLAVVLVSLFFTLTKFAAAGGSSADFTSMILQTTQQPLQITVGADRSLVIRNFTQDGGMVRGSVSVMTSTFSANNVLTATIVNPMAAQGTLEVVNDIVIAGPATVTVTPGDATCFITYRKIDD